MRELLVERRETPAPDSIAQGNIKIVSKIRFDVGRIELRQDTNSKTDMILVCPGDILLSGINAAKGAIAVYGLDNSMPVAATIHYSAYSVIKNRADTSYLWWYLRSRPFREILSAALPGGIKTELKSSRFLPLIVPLPPLAEQRRIVNQIVGLSNQIHSAEKTRIESLKQTKFLVEAGIEAAMRPAEAKGKVADIISFNPRSGPSFVTHHEWSGTPVLMPSAVSGFGVDVTKVEFGIGTEQINKKDFLEPGDILIARGNKREQEPESVRFETPSPYGHSLELF
ncbi:MAG: hypothetical protein M0T76_00305 [Desulfobacteraceae bacterium]|nr:hypothetical protein [Desulfobacteraceae bacterium]